MRILKKKEANLLLLQPAQPDLPMVNLLKDRATLVISCLLA